MAGFDAERRSTDPELMDAGDTDYATFRGCLVDLARVNRLSLGYRPTLLFLERLRREGRFPQGRPLRIVDVGSGHGDMLRKIVGWADAKGVAVELTGVDLNPWSARAAAEATPVGSPISWVTEDVFAYEPSHAIDVVLSALFAHHLDDAGVTRFLRWMESRAEIGWFVNDLHRHRISYEGFRLGSKLLGFHPFVQHDGPVSIARAFRRRDWTARLAEAGFLPDDAEIEWRTPFRLCVARVKSG